MLISCLLRALDNSNALLYGLPKYKIQRLQYVLNSAVTLSRKNDHISPVLMELHWLPVEQRVEFKIILYTYKVVNSMAPVYLHKLLDFYIPGRSLRSGNMLLLKTQSHNLKSYGFNLTFSMCPPALECPSTGDKDVRFRRYKERPLDFPF